MIPKQPIIPNKTAFSPRGLQKNKPMWKPHQPAVNFNISKPLQKRSPIKSKSAEHKTKASLRTFKFETFTSKCRVTFLKFLNLYVPPVIIWNLCVEPFSLDVEPWSETFMWNLYAEIFIWSFYPEHSWQTCLRKVYVEPLCGTSGTWIILSNLSQEPWNLYLWNLGTWKSGTFMEPWTTWPFMLNLNF